jgi:hypothetical protein
MMRARGDRQQQIVRRAVSSRAGEGGEMPDHEELLGASVSRAKHYRKSKRCERRVSGLLSVALMTISEEEKFAESVEASGRERAEREAFIRVPVRCYASSKERP